MGHARRHSRELELELGLEQPERMRRYERWLRSPFSEEYIDRSRSRLARHSCRVYSELCEHHIGSNKAFVEDAVNGCKSTPCERCGCSNEFDSCGDRICW